MESFSVSITRVIEPVQSENGNANPDEKDSNLIVLGQGYGPVRFGMTREAVIDAIGQPQETYHGVLQYLDHGFAVFFDRSGRVNAIMCGDAHSPDSPLVERFVGRTPEGIGMGSTPEEVVAAYGQPQKRRGELTMFYRQLGAEFTFLENKLAHIQLRPAR